MTPPHLPAARAGHHVPLREERPAKVPRGWLIARVALLAMLLALCHASGARADPTVEPSAGGAAAHETNELDRAARSELSVKRAQAERLAQQIAILDDRLSLLVEEYDRGRYYLQKADQDEAAATRRVAAADRALTEARLTLDRRVRRVYQQGPFEALALLFSSRSTAQLVTRTRYLTEILQSDHRAVEDVRRRAADLEERRRELIAERARRETLLEKVETDRDSVEAALAARRGQLASVGAEVRTLVEEERRRALERQTRELSFETPTRPAASNTLRPTASTALPPTAESTAPPATATALRPAADTTTVVPRASTTSTRPSARTSTTHHRPPTTEPPAPVAPPPSSARGARIVAIALQYLGVPYVWGGETPAGFDCSGLTMYALGRVGVDVPHSSFLQSLLGRPVTRGQLEPGDLVFFGDPVHHVGIYASDRTFIEAPYTGATVRVSPFGRTDFVGGRRF